MVMHKIFVGDIPYHNLQKFLKLGLHCSFVSQLLKIHLARDDHWLVDVQSAAEQLNKLINGDQGNQLWGCYGNLTRNENESASSETIS